MGKDLSGEGGHLHFSHADWRGLLELAYEHGWEPAGTEPHRVIDPETGDLDPQWSTPEPWDGSYFGNFCFQWVTDEDAANIAEALERALEGDEELNSGYLREFITFCRAGDFTIA